ncbi:ankyrin [Tothia fuscella]|uniref:Ankyrin n=1 Tax=Tothia fuscella TaxID=1048955 RepID=A0A9P4P568_9PEZI|nr:ankyrin [Tothia fuscella]
MSTHLSEDEIDDILYCARANELQELRECVDAASRKYGTEGARVVVEVVDAESGNNALHFAGANGLLEITKYILSLFTPTTTSGSDSTSNPTSNPNPSRHAFVNAQNQSGNTPLHWAALNGHLEAVKVLMEAGADVTVLNQRGYDAIFEAEMNDKSAVVEFLLREGVGVDRGVGGGIGGAGGEGGSGEGNGEEEQEDVVVGVGKMDLEGSEVENMDVDMRVDGDEKGKEKVVGERDGV